MLKILNIDPALIILFILFYIYGSIPFAFIFTYLIKGEIIYEHRTRNVGVANAFGVGGYPAGFLTVAGETSKVLLPMIVSRLYFDNDPAVSLTFIIFASLGTSFSVFLKGKGGMGTTILMWTLIFMAPLTILILVATWFVTSKLARDTYYSSLANNALMPVAIFGVTRDTAFTLFGVVKAIIFFIKYDRSRDDFRYASPLSRVIGRRAENRYIKNIKEIKTDKWIGEKAAKLKYLLKEGYKIPDTYVCDFRAYQEYKKGDRNVLAVLQEELEGFIDDDRNYAVRSSANVEDVPGRAFAGQFKSYLNVKGLKPIAQSIENVWLSTKSERLSTYLEQFGLSEEKLEMAVIIQEMLPAKFSGLVFTKNPMNGRDEVIVEAVLGLGDALMQAGVTPYRWVYKWGDWIEVPEDCDIELDIIKEIVSQAKSMERQYGSPLNFEWAHNGEELYWLQLREITTISGLNFYSNRIPKEFFPGIIKPLVWSINVPMVCGGWIRLLTEIIGEKDLDPYELAKSFYYRAYFNMGVIGDVFDLFGMPREGLELLMGLEVAGKEKPSFKPGLKSTRLLPRMIRFALDKAFFSRKIERFLKTYTEENEEFDLADIENLSEDETINILDKIYEVNEDASYYVIISQLLNSFYNMMLKNRLEKKGLSIGEIDFGMEGYRDIDPNYHLSLLHDGFNALKPEDQRRIVSMSYGQLAESPDLSDFHSKVQGFFSTFGHLCDRGNDFSSIPWRETPDLVLNMVLNYVKPEVESRPKKEIHSVFRGPFSGLMTKAIHRRVLKYLEYKERISFLYTYGYGLFRPYFLHLGRIFKEKGYIEEDEDIFYLTFDEVKDIVRLKTMPIEYRDEYRKRMEEIAECKDVELPEVIYGDEAPVPIIRDKVLKELKGVAASAGYYRGRVKVVKGLMDFGKMEEGDVLVIPYSDIGWAPLFAKAKAVVSEAGGILSHSAITAREYGIPAVVGVKNALELRDNSLVLVDGFNGKILMISSQREGYASVDV